MEPIIEKRIQVLCDSMSTVKEHIEAITKWLNENMKKAPKGTSFGDVITTSLFGGGLIGMAINRKIRTAKKSTKVIYDGMTADDMAQDIVLQLTKLVDSQCEIQNLVGKDEEPYYGYVNNIFQLGYKYYIAWLMFTSYYSMSHKIEYDGQRMTLEKMVRVQCSRQFQRLDLDEKTRKAVNKEFK